MHIEVNSRITWEAGQSDVCQRQSYFRYQNNNVCASWHFLSTTTRTTTTTMCLGGKAATGSSGGGAGGTRGRLTGTERKEREAKTKKNFLSRLACCVVCDVS